MQQQIRKRIEIRERIGLEKERQRGDREGSQLVASERRTQQPHQTA
jgi:hypothetical protein